MIIEPLASFFLVVAAAPPTGLPATFDPVEVPPPPVMELRTQEPVALDEPPLPPEDVRTIGFVGTPDDIAKLKKASAEHARICEELGRSICRINRFTEFSRKDGNGNLEVRLSPSANEDFVSKVTAARHGLSFNAQSDNQRNYSGSSVSEAIASRARITGGLKELESLIDDEDPKVRASVSRQIQNLERELKVLDRQAEEAKLKEDFVTLSVSYRAEDFRGREFRAVSKFDELFEMFLLVSISAVGLAIVVCLYLGIMGFSVLKLRQLAIRWGLLSGVKNTAGGEADKVPDP